MVSFFELTSFLLCYTCCYCASGVPVLSIVSLKYDISSGNNTPKLSVKPRLMEVMTAAEKQTTHDHELSSERLPLKSHTMLFNVKLPRREPISQCAESRPYNKGARFNQLQAIKAHRGGKKCMPLPCDDQEMPNIR